MNRNIYNEKEIPFKELERMLPDMKFPKKAIARLLKGRLSPLMKLDVESKGKHYSLPAKIALARENGNVCVKIFPIRKEIDNALSLSEKELSRIKENETIRITRDGEDLFVQIDPETKTLMSAKADDIRIPHAIGDVTVGETQREQMRNGNPVQIEIGGEKVTVGVDLNDSTGFKVVNGDLNKWKEKKLMEWDRTAPGITGHWNTSENGWEYQKNIEKEEKEERGLSRGFGFRR